MRRTSVIDLAIGRLVAWSTLQSITPDRGREFQLHGNVTKELGVEFYFPPPHQWRGTNKNTNVFHSVALSLTIRMEVEQDRKSTFAPQIISKRQKDISDIDRKNISIYGRGSSTRQISETIEELYGFEVS